MLVPENTGIDFLNSKYILTALKHYFISSLLTVALLAAGCKDSPKQETPSAPPPAETLFKLLPPAVTHIDFSNTLTEAFNTNVLIYEYFYNGGGVAAGDINGDGLDDLYFTANMAADKLYLNAGGMKFTEITQPSGIHTRNGPWKTGVTMADVNGDGKLDLYICYSGNLRPERRVNELYINYGNDANGIPQFKEEGKKYGLDSPSTSTQGYFFDYDRDGDLDMFLLNHNINALPVLNEASTAQMLKEQDPASGVRLFKNVNNHFDDVTAKSGISSTALTYGLGAGLADLNNDGWTDIYITNDYNVPDYLYINNGNGTFTDKLKSMIGHTSNFSMGNDIADVNNDALPDIFTLDMLPEDNHRQKLLLAPDNYGKFDLNIRIGFYYQYMRNMLQLNNGNGTFSEIGQLSGVSNTDWSWAALFADYDNDGWKDLYITNGYLRDFTNMDFVKYMDNYVQQKGRLMREDVLELVHKIPASNLTNYIFRSNGDLSFTKANTAWGFTNTSNSNGAAYSDLDNDGDLDLVVNNINAPAFIYQNETNKKSQHHYLKIKLEGAGKNTVGLGTKIIVHVKGAKQTLEQMPSRGYQSSVSPTLHVGLGKEANIDSMQIIWLSGKQQKIKNIKSDQLITVREIDADSKYIPSRTPGPVFTEKAILPFAHEQERVNDFKRQPLMVNPMSFSGPCLAKGDVNGDRLEDIYAGGGVNQAGELFLQQKNGQFVRKNQPAFEADKKNDDTDAVFADVNKDGYTDLYVCSGGYHNFMPEDEALQDRLYINDGKGNFKKNTDALPPMRTSKSCVRVSDVNGDGYPDLFVGSRVIPGRYPETPSSYILINDGKGNFKDAIATLAPALQTIGMVTDAAFTDLNGDGKNDLIVIGEWMPVTVWIQENGKFIEKTSDYFSQKYRGWWNKILTGDFNQDGKTDLIVGNTGLNTQCKVSDAEPAELYFKDFDNNGSVDPILCTFIQGKSYTYVTRDELLEQIGSKRKRFPDYKSYADATLQDIFTPEELNGVSKLSANCLRTTLFLSDAQGKFHKKTLPVEAQVSPVYVIMQLDYNHDGKDDLILGGNIQHARLKFGKYDANHGILLEGDGNGNFKYVTQQQSGLKLIGDVRSSMVMDKKILFGINQGQVKSYTYK
ncbi:VCBS repeat-containing protein [Ohtaekwangia koreensis]|uniref:Repeat domain-containing protein n=1 Tax=Ohtaekwangia koreensis TaxID=688867 RepID=A0A1T5MHM3_9BACT|nr:VCBS repeat-containing protein [Ohtaekwangia koreensis]SKC87418.1 Repeat domain-containing protein [Ohtaekwangia koreensis]